MDAKYITKASGEPILSWLTIYTIRVSFMSYKGLYIIFHLSKTTKKQKQKQKPAKEVTFSFKIFSTEKSLIKSGSENDF